MINKILVPLDGSKLGEVVLPYVEELIKRLNPEVTFLGVYPPNLEQLAHEHKVYLEHTAESIVEKYGDIVRTIVVSGQENRAIVDYSVNEDVGLIVGVSRGKSDTKKWTIGSTADKVIRETSKPVLVINADTEKSDVENKILNRVLVPLDGSKASQEILPFVKSLISGISMDSESKVTLFRVIPAVHHVPVGEAVVSVPYTEAELEQLKIQAENYLKEVGRDLQTNGLNIEYSIAVRNTSTAEQILDCAAQNDINLIAMSTHGRTGISKLFLGATTDRVLHSVHIPLLLVKPELVE